MDFKEAVKLIEKINEECDAFRSLNSESINNEIICIELKIRKQQ